MKEQVHYDIEKSKAAARGLLEECGLSKHLLQQIPRKKRYTDAELTTILNKIDHGTYEDE